MSYKTILVVPDSHAKKDVDNRRYSWLGKFIVERKPDAIVNIGDWYDMESLSSYDKGKKSFEGRSYKADVEAGNEAIRLVETEIKKVNDKLRQDKRKLYKPQKISLLGNHEQRIERAINEQRELDGTIGYDDFEFEKFGWDVIPFLKPIFIEGIAFAHYFPTGVMGRPVSGETPALKLIRTQFNSCVMGHIHTRDFAERTGADGSRKASLVVGCYLDPTQYESYAGEANKIWWKGLVMLNNVKNGSFDPEFISIETLQEKYERT